MITRLEKPLLLPGLAQMRQNDPLTSLNGFGHRKRSSFASTGQGIRQRGKSNAHSNESGRCDVHHGADDQRRLLVVVVGLRSVTFFGGNTLFITGRETDGIAPRSQWVH